MEETHFYLLRTTTTQEDAVVDMLYQKALTETDSGVYGVFHPGPIKGYVFMEARDLGDAIQLVQGVPHTKGFVKGEVDFEKEVKPLLQPKSSVLDVSKGDLVELIAGPFKGEKAKVIRVDSGKEEVTVELIEATVPIPVTAKGMHIKLVDRVTQEKAEESQKKAVIGEGPLPAFRTPKMSEKREVAAEEPAVKKKEKSKKIVIGSDLVDDKEEKEEVEEKKEATEEKKVEEKEEKADEKEDSDDSEEDLDEEEEDYFADDEETPEDIITKKKKK